MGLFSTPGHRLFASERLVDLAATGVRDARVVAALLAMSLAGLGMLVITSLR